MARKRPREASNARETLIEIYDDFANLNESIRLKAVHSLITIFVVSPEANVEQLNEIFTRLIRGLCSGRKAARIGFSVALTTFLSELRRQESIHGLESFLKSANLLRLLKGHTDLTKATSVHEQREFLLGRLFGVEAFIRSGLVFADVDDPRPWTSAVEIIVQMAAEKTLLREECGYVLFAAIRDSVVPSHSPDYSRIIVKTLQSFGLIRTPEGAAIWITLQSKYPGTDLPRGVWHQQSPLSEKERPALARILREATSPTTAHDKGENAVSKGQWSAKPHFAWQAIISQILPENPSKLASSVHFSGTSDPLMFQKFWITCVDTGLFGPASSTERKYQGFMLLQQLIAELPCELIKEILSPTCVRCFINHIGSNDRFLHRAAEKLRRAILKRCDVDPDAITAVLTGLIAPPLGDMSFDRRTKTKTVETLLSNAARAGNLEVLHLLEELMLLPGADNEKSTIFARQMLVEHLVNAVRSIHINPSMERRTMDFMQEALFLISRFAYFDIPFPPKPGTDVPMPKVTEASRNMFRTRMSSLLSYLIAQPLDASQVAYDLVLGLNKHQDQLGAPQSLLQLEPEMRKVMDDALETLQSLQSEKEQRTTDTGTYKSRILLVALSILQVHNGDPDAIGILEDLRIIFHREAENLGELEKRDDVGAIVEILLSLVSKPSQLFRRVSHDVFASLTPDITEQGLEPMVKVLGTKETLSGQAEVYDIEEEGGVIDSDADEVDATDSTTPGTADLDDTEPESSDSSQSPGSSGPSVHGEADESDDEAATFNAKLAQALGTNVDQEGHDAETESSSDEAMDDEQMAKLDTHLELMFKERKVARNKKSERKGAKDAIVNFKCRILELLEIYIKHRHADAICLKLILPVLVLARTSTSPLVSRKACELVREYSRFCKGEGVPKPEQSHSTLDLLRSIHDEAGNQASNAHASACSQASLILVRSLVRRDKRNLREVIKIYASTQEKALFDQGFGVRTAFFLDWLNWSMSLDK